MYMTRSYTAELYVKIIAEPTSFIATHDEGTCVYILQLSSNRSDR